MPLTTDARHAMPGPEDLKSKTRNLIIGARAADVTMQNCLHCVPEDIKCSAGRVGKST